MPTVPELPSRKALCLAPECHASNRALDPSLRGVPHAELFACRLKTSLSRRTGIVLIRLVGGFAVERRLKDSFGPVMNSALSTLTPAGMGFLAHLSAAKHRDLRATLGSLTKASANWVRVSPLPHHSLDSSSAQTWAHQPVLQPPISWRARPVPRRLVGSYLPVTRLPELTDDLRDAVGGGSADTSSSGSARPANMRWLETNLATPACRRRLYPIGRNRKSEIADLSTVHRRVTLLVCRGRCRHSVHCRDDDVDLQPFSDASSVFRPVPATGPGRIAHGEIYLVAGVLSRDRP